MTKFKDLQIGDKFSMNGLVCTKKSSRTAWIGGESKFKWFYFGMNESVTRGWK